MGLMKKITKKNCLVKEKGLGEVLMEVRDEGL